MYSFHGKAEFAAVITQVFSVTILQNYFNMLICAKETFIIIDVENEFFFLTILLFLLYFFYWINADFDIIMCISYM